MNLDMGRVIRVAALMLAISLCGSLVALVIAYITAWTGV